MCECMFRYIGTLYKRSTALHRFKNYKKNLSSTNTIYALPLFTPCVHSIFCTMLFRVTARVSRFDKQNLNLHVKRAEM
jgi:hypothetical protein